MNDDTAASDVLILSNRRRWAVLAGVLIGMFIAALEATVVGTAMPTVIASLGGLDHYSWVFSAYLVTSTVTVPVWGKLSDLYGRRLLYQIGIGVFLIGSLLSGISTSMTQLIIFRAIQGLGAGALVPLGMTIIGDIFTVAERARMQAFFSGVWGLSSIIGPFIGGFITDQLTWRWVFFVNLPIGVVTALVMGFALKEPKVKNRPVIDYAGAAVLMIAISLLMLALVESGSVSQMLSPLNVALLAVSIVLLCVFYVIETRAADPIIPFGLFRNRTVAVSVGAGFLAGIAMFGAISFIPLFSQGALGSTATEAGSLLTPLMLSWVTMSVIGGRLMLKISYRNIAVAGFSVLTVGFVALSLFQTTTPRIWLYVDLCLVGAGLGLTMLTLLIAVQEAVERSRLGIATSLNQFSRSIGGAIGVAIMGSVLTVGLSIQIAHLSTGENSVLTREQATAFAENPNVLIDPEARGDLDPATLARLQEAMASAIRPVFWVGAIISVLALLIVSMLPAAFSAAKSKDGEKLLMAEHTTINPRNQPDMTDP
jgi:EmrB/QacA subfamily drug resistance transporter